MAFNPSSTIYLCSVPFDSTYQNVVYFSSRAAQREYFTSKVVKTFADYLTVRATRPDGSLKSSVKVNANIDTLRGLPCNYMYYQNANHGNRIFYAFITRFVYINENTTEIIFETDVYQTWMLDCSLKMSYVVREHSKTDAVGDNVVPEKFNFQEYTYEEAKKDATLNKWGYLVGTTQHDLTDPTFWEELFGSSNNVVVNGKMMSGIYQGLFFYYFHNEHNLNKFLNVLVERYGDCIMFISTIPYFSVSENIIGVEGDDWSDGEGYLSYSSIPAEQDIMILDATKDKDFEGYKPVNNKLFTAPYYKLIVTNHSGDQAEYNIEDFLVPHEIMFTMYGDVSANPSITLVPVQYQGITHNYDCGISLGGFPQCSYNTDTFKLWLAKNQFGIAADTVGNIGQIVAGVASIAAAAPTGGLSLAVGAGAIASGANGIIGTVNSTYQASREPNKGHGTGAKNNLLTAMGDNRFRFYFQKIRRNHAQTVDDFFTMYGYQTNRVKVPNVSSRPHFNYVQTVDVNIIGSIPSDDMATLKAIYNRGVTLWKPASTIGDYTVDNRPT